MTETKACTIGEFINANVLVLFELGNNLIWRAEHQVVHQFIPIEFFTAAQISKINFLGEPIFNTP